jgi:iron(III) transport system permease protein
MTSSSRPSAARRRTCWPACWRSAVWLPAAGRARRGKARYARIGSGAAREQQRQPLGRLAAIPLQLALLTLVMLALGVPLMVLCRWLWLGGGELDERRSLALLRQTLLLGAVGALLTTACAIPIAWLGVRYPQRLFACWRGVTT